MIKGEHQQAMRERSEEEGVFTAAQAHRRGIPRDALSYACKTGVLERVSHGAYRLVGAPTTEAPDLIALWKLTDSGKFSRERTKPAEWDGVVVGGTTAATLLGLGEFHLSPYRIYAPKRINSRKADVRFGVREIERADVRWRGGVPVTIPERTLLDLVLDCEDPSLVSHYCRDAFKHDFDEERAKVLFARQFGEKRGARMLENLRNQATI